MTKSRRQWSNEEKQRIVLEAFKPGADKKAIAKREGVALSLIYRWEKWLNTAHEEFRNNLMDLDAIVKQRFDQIEKQIDKHQQAISDLEKEKAAIAARLRELARNFGLDD